MRTIRVSVLLLIMFSAVAVIGCSPKERVNLAAAFPRPPALVQRNFPDTVDSNFRPQAAKVRLTQGTTAVVVSYAPNSGPAEAATRVVITRAGAPIFDRVVDANIPRTVTLAGTHSTREPLLILKTYSAGAHCCIDSIVIDAESDTDVHMRRDGWGDGDFTVRPGTRTKDPVLVGLQAAMPYTFGPFAGTAFVVKVMRYDHGELTNAASSYPEIVNADAQHHLRDYLHEGSGGRPMGKSSLVAYMIDMCRIGRCNEGWRKLDDVYGEPDRAEFFPAVIRALKQYGTAIPATG